MDMDIAPGTIVWTAVCLVALGFALWRPGAGRRALGVLFVIMAVGVDLVFILALRNGSVDLGAAAPPPSPWWAFERVVSASPAAFSLLVASYGVAVGLMMVKGGRWGSLGLVGGVILLLVVAPLGPWLVPNLIMATALGAVLLRDLRLPSSLRGVEPAPSGAGRADGDDGALPF